MKSTVLDELFAAHEVSCSAQPITVSPEDLAHVAGTQEPVREQPDERAKYLLKLGLLAVEQIQIDLSEDERAARISAVQQAARTYLQQHKELADDALQQIRWLSEKTRSHESKLQIRQRVWLALVLYSLGKRALRFDAEGQIIWDGGITGRIGLSADAVLDLAWSQEDRQAYTASFRHPDGTIMRGKGRHRWYVYRLTVDLQAAALFEQRERVVDEQVALVIASETFATQPQLPRDFYGGDSFQQACIDAQDGHYDHILVLSPKHGVITLDDIVKTDIGWDEVMERRLWAWQIQAVQRLGAYLAGQPLPKDLITNCWSWLNPDSTYRLTIFGGGFAARFLVEHLLRVQEHSPDNYPKIVFVEQRPGYDAGDLDEDFVPPYHLGMDDDERYAEREWEADDEQDLIEHYFEWASEFAGLITVYVAPTGEIWELAADEALIPVRILAAGDLPMDDLLGLLTDITLLFERSLPINLLINAGLAVSALVQVSHSLVHNDRAAIDEMLDDLPDIALRQYIDQALQEQSQEDRLCALLTLAEQLQMLVLSIPLTLNEQLITWMHTYVASHMRHRLMDNDADNTF